MIFPAVILGSSEPTGLLFWCAVGFYAGIGLFFYGFRLLQRRRLILDTPFSKIRSAPMGMVEVSGQAIGPYTMVAPITARPCYYYRTLVWEWKQSGKNKQWVKVAAECMHLPFFVDDNTGRLLVDPRGADLELHCDFKEEFNGSFFSSHDSAPGNVNSFLARHGIVTDNKIKVEEYCIKPKNSLFILGTLADNPGTEVTAQPVQGVEPAGSISAGRFSITLKSFSISTGSGNDFDAGSFARAFAAQAGAGPSQTVQSVPAVGQIHKSNLTQQQLADVLLKAGISNPAAWAAAGVTSADSGSPVPVFEDTSAVSAPTGGTAVSNTTSSAPSHNGFDLHPPVVLMKGVNNKTFLISWRSQQEVARSLGWKCTLMIWGGPALALICLYFFLSIEKLF